MGNLFGKKLDAEAEAALQRSKELHRAETALLKVKPRNGRKKEGQAGRQAGRWTGVES